MQLTSDYFSDGADVNVKVVFRCVPVEVQCVSGKGASIATAHLLQIRSESQHKCGTR